VNCGRWDIVDVDYGIPLGHEQGKRRPAIVVSNNAFNHSAGMATVLAVTSRQQPRYPSEVALPTHPGVVDRGVIMVQQIRTVDGARVVRIRGQVTDPVLQRQIEEAIVAFLDLGGGHAP
jgi:mRNA interferase MazF